MCRVVALTAAVRVLAALLPVDIRVPPLLCAASRCVWEFSAVPSAAPCVPAVAPLRCVGPLLTGPLPCSVLLDWPGRMMGVGGGPLASAVRGPSRI